MLSPADYCREDWHCLICEAPREMLRKSFAYGGDYVECAKCAFPYHLQIPAEGSKKRYVPKPIQNKRWRDIWYRAFLHFENPRSTWRFMRQFSTAAQANNAMNRLDGGGMIARERASREKNER